eukprot:s73_g6.t1
MQEGSSSSDGSGSDGPPVDFRSIPGYSRLPCNQCLFFTSPSGCKQGDACAFCHHIVQQGAPTARPRRGRRDSARQLIWELLEQLDVEKQEPQEIVYKLQLISQRTDYCRILTQSGVDSLLQRFEHERRVQGQAVPQRRVNRNGTCGALDCFSL